MIRAMRGDLFVVVVMTAVSAAMASDPVVPQRRRGAGRLSPVMQGYRVTQERQATTNTGYVRLNGPVGAPIRTASSTSLPKVRAAVSQSQQVTDEPPTIAAPKSAQTNTSAESCGESIGIAGGAISGASGACSSGGCPNGACSDGSCIVCRQTAAEAREARRWQKKLFREEQKHWLLDRLHGPSPYTVELPGHEIYQTNGFYYYLRPYNAAHIPQHQAQVIRHAAGTPQHPYADRPFAELYKRFAASPSTEVDHGLEDDSLVVPPPAPVPNP